MNEVQIKRVNAEDIVDLRWRVLRVGMPREAAIFPNDPEGIHVAALAGEKVVCCGTMLFEPYENQPAWRLRGMATEEDWRGKGLGKKVLELAISEAQSRTKTSVIWCDARIGAIKFYADQGWMLVSGEYVVPTAGVHRKMMKRLGPP